MLGAIQKGFLDANGVTREDQLGDTEWGLYGKLSVEAVLDALSGAAFTDAGKPSAVSEDGKDHTIIAQAHYHYEQTSTIDFFDAFFAQGDTAQYQTVIHEGMHLIWGIGDISFAKAAGVYKEGMRGNAASEAWNKKLKEACK